MERWQFRAIARNRIPIGNPTWNYVNSPFNPGAPPRTVPLTLVHLLEHKYIFKNIEPLSDLHHKEHVSFFGIPPVFGQRRRKLPNLLLNLLLQI